MQMAPVALPVHADKSFRGHMLQRFLLDYVNELRSVAWNRKPIAIKIVCMYVNCLEMNSSYHYRISKCRVSLQVATS